MTRWEIRHLVIEHERASLLSIGQLRWEFPDVVDVVEKALKIQAAKKRPRKKAR